MTSRTERMRKLLFDAGVAANIIEGRDDYAKFVILGRGRTGSNFLRTSLASHNNIVVFAELFNAASRREGRLLWGGLPGYRSRNRGLLSLRESDPRRFLDEAVFARMPGKVRAVGFKLFYYHARGDWSCVWPHLRSLDIRAIHLRRRNLLSVQVSGILAAQSGAWMTTSSKRAQPRQPVVLDYDGCLRFFERTRAFEAEYGAYFEHTLDLFYEDLVADYEGQTRIVQEFLEVPWQPLSSPLKKQISLPLHETISNYDELKGRFAGSEWESFFDAP